jgi:hypothetical protein
VKRYQLRSTYSQPWFGVAVSTLGEDEEESDINSCETFTHRFSQKEVY